MAIHGRRANAKIRKLNKGVYGGGNNPAINQYTENGSFPKTGGMSTNQLGQYTSKDSSFNHAGTSTNKGAKRVMHHTIRNNYKKHARKASHGRRHARKASHGRRHASARTKQMKIYKKQARRANAKIRKLNKGLYGGRNNPAIHHYTKNGRFPKAGGMSTNQLRHYTSKASSFNHAETSTTKGAKRVMHQTIRNIFGGHGQTTEQEIKSMNNINIYLNDPEKGRRLIRRYFDVYYNVKDKLSSMHISNVSSDEIMNAFKKVISTDEIIKYTREEISTHNIGDATVEVEEKVYFDLLDSAELINKIIDDLE